MERKWIKPQESSPRAPENMRARQLMTMTTIIMMMMLTIIDDDDDRHNRHHDDDETAGGRQRICVPDNYQKSVFKLSIMIHKLLFPIHSFPNYFFSPSLHSSPSPLSPHSSPPLLNISGTTCRTWQDPPMLPSGLTSKTFQRWKKIFNHVIVISSVAGFRQRLQHHDQCILQREMERSEVVSQQRLQQGGSPARGNTNTRRITFSN